MFLSDTPSGAKSATIMSLLKLHTSHCPVLLLTALILNGLEVREVFKFFLQIAQGRRNHRAQRFSICFALTENKTSVNPGSSQ